jgi:hypothetical protein
MCCDNNLAKKRAKEKSGEKLNLVFGTRKKKNLNIFRGTKESRKKEEEEEKRRDKLVGERENAECVEP